MTPAEILKENGISMVKIDKGWFLEKDDKRIPRPTRPKDCYQVLIEKFGIDDPRLKE